MHRHACTFHLEVGIILDTLERLQLTDKTMIVFTSLTGRSVQDGFIVFVSFCLAAEGQHNNASENFAVVAPLGAGRGTSRRLWNADVQRRFEECNAPHSIGHSHSRLRCGTILKAFAVSVACIVLLTRTDFRLHVVGRTSSSVKIVKEPVSTIDIAPTIAQVLNLATVRIVALSCDMSSVLSLPP